MCSFVLANIHPPTRISACVALPGGICVLSRGNELVLASLDESGLVFEKKVTLFGHIAALSSFENHVFVLLSSEILLHFEYDDSKLHCRAKYACAQPHGTRVSKFLLSSHTEFIIAHTRTRTITLFNENTFFPAMIPIAEVYHVQCFGDTFMVFGKSFKGYFSMMLFAVDWSSHTVNKIKSVKLFATVGNTHAVSVRDDGSFIVSSDETVKAYNHDHQLELTLESKKPFTCLYQHYASIFGFDDAGMIDLETEQRILRLNPSESVVKIGDDFCFHLSSNGDAHVLKIGESVVKVYETYGQLNAVEFMDRSRFITKDGKLRSIVNGSLSALEVQATLYGGRQMWSVGDYIYVSTYGRTVCLDSNFSLIESPLSRDESSLLVAEVNDMLIQVTNGMIFIDDMCVYESDAEIVMAVVRNEHIAIALANKIVRVFALSNANLLQITEIDTVVDVSAMALSTNAISLAKWNDSIITTFALEDGCEITSQTVDCDFISSLLYTENDDLVIGCSGEIIFQGRKIRTGHSNVVLRKIRDRIAIVSDTCWLFDGDNLMCFETPGAALDLVPYGEHSMAVLTPESIAVLTIESQYPAHIEDHHILRHSISLLAVDESHRFPVVFAAKKSDRYHLISPKLPTATLSNPDTIPRSLLWIEYRGQKMLLVGCQDGSAGKIFAYDVKLQLIPGISITFGGPIDAMTFVNNEYLAVAVANSLSLVRFDDTMKLVVSDRTETRCACASLTSPNSCAIVYADKYASVIIYTAIDGKLAEISRDFNPKGLKFARLESENDVIAIGDDGVIYDIEMDAHKRMSTKSAFAVDASCCAVLNAPNLVFITESGALCGIFKAKEEFSRIFDAMRMRITGIGDLSISDYRCVVRNNKTYDFGKFVDWDFVLNFTRLDPKEKLVLSRDARIPVETIEECIAEFSEMLVAYKKDVQTRFII